MQLRLPVGNRGGSVAVVTRREGVLRCECVECPCKGMPTSGAVVWTCCECASEATPECGSPS